MRILEIEKKHRSFLYFVSNMVYKIGTFMRLPIFIICFLVFPWLCAGQTFFEYYEEGVKYAEIDSLNEAETCFKQALKFRNKDDKQARTYGMHFMEYFPNRELGILYYKGQHLDLAIDFLEKSMSDEPSDRAREYLLAIGQVRHDRGPVRGG